MLKNSCYFCLTKERKKEVCGFLYTPSHHNESYRLPRGLDCHVDWTGLDCPLATVVRTHTGDLDNTHFPFLSMELGYDLLPDTVVHAYHETTALAPIHAYIDSQAFASPRVAQLLITYNRMKQCDLSDEGAHWNEIREFCSARQPTAPHVGG